MAVVWPGFLGNAGPCTELVGGGRGRGSAPWTAVLGARNKGCNDDAWPDGEGEMSVYNATGWTVYEQMMRMDQLDWTEGVGAISP